VRLQFAAVPFSLTAPGLDLGLSSCPLFDYRLASRRLALVCKLPLILGTLQCVSRTNQYPLGATPGSHIHRVWFIAERPFGSRLWAPFSAAFTGSLGVHPHLAIERL